jgi:hypothetical protein
MVHVQDRRVERVLHAPLQRVVVADGAAALQAAWRTNRTRAEQQGFGEAGFSGGRGPDQGQGADGGNAG